MNFAGESPSTIIRGGRAVVEIRGTVAAKRLDPCPDVRFQLRREAIALAACHHSALPRLLSWREDPATLQMTGFSGINLETYIEQEGPLEPAMIRTMLRTVASALRHMHSLGLFHLDVKPRNIVLEPSGTDMVLRLIDLGSSAGPRLPLPPIGEDRFRRLGGGRFLHCRFEQLVQDIEALGRHWDAFGLGASGFYARFGRWPFYNDDRNQVTAERYSHLINRFQAIDSELEAIRALLDPRPGTALRCLDQLARDSLSYEGHNQRGLKVGLLPDGRQ